MMRYFFNIRDGDQLIRDDEGMRCEDMEAARFEARCSARDLIAQEIAGGRLPDGRKIEITDGDGAVMETVTLRDVLYGYVNTTRH